MSTDQLPSFPFDTKAKKAIEEYKNGVFDQPMVFVNSRDDSNKAFRLNYEFEALGDVIVGEFGHSVLVRFTDPTDLDEFKKIEDIVAEMLPAGLTFKESLREEKLFIKLQTKDGRYKASFNPPISPSALDKSPIHQGSLLDISFQPNLWINFSSQNAGIYLNISTITVDGGKKRPNRRR